ncbi:MAG: hypothetical protein IJU66_07760 [Oscillospiraceae bacterium]|nr:hypothetical protein [Oscillospiraceae bacterium]
MTIESLGLTRPASGPMKKGAAERQEKKSQSAAPGRGFDAAEVRGDRPPRAPYGSDTEAVLGRLHERGLLTNVSRPLGPDGQPISAKGGYGRAYGGESAESAPVAREAMERIKEHKNEHVLRMRGHDMRPPEPAHAQEGRVYGRPRPQAAHPAEEPQQQNGVFTIKLYSPKENTGKTLRIGSHVIPLEADGSILAGMPDGTVRRITFDQDVMDEMVARGEVWMEGDKPEQDAVHEADNAGAGTEGFNESQKQLIRKAYDLLKRQAELANKTGFVNTCRGEKAHTEEQKPLTGSGAWSVETLSRQIIDYAKELAGDDPEKLAQMRDAFVRAHANFALEESNGTTTGVTAQTFIDTVKQFDELTAPKAEAKPEAAEKPNHHGRPEHEPKPGHAGKPKETGKPDKPDKAKSDAEEVERYKPDTALVDRLKADLERRQQQMLDLVREMLGKQGKKISGEGIWRTIAKGDFQVDAATKEQAQKDIAEDGFWGVEQTSDRIVQFAVGLTGGNPAMIDKMVEAFEKGYAEAEKTWGGALPELSQRTRDRVLEKFEELKKQNGVEGAAGADEPENGGGAVVLNIAGV